MTPAEQAEWLVCAESPAYFLDRYCQIYDATLRTWIPFRLWPAQLRTLRTIRAHLLTVILKARQLGLSWLVLGVALHEMIFKPAATVSLFSRREEEAVYLLGPERMRGMYTRLPSWMWVRGVLEDNDTTWHLSNGSIARAFPTTAGDAYTVSLAIVDEADLAPDLGTLMTAAKPTIDGGGRMILLSRTNKKEPQSEFKQIYRGAKRGENGWAHVFLPWDVRPERDAAWYATQERDIVSRTGAKDDLYEQYPATDTEALAPASLLKRIPSGWLEQCYIEQQPLSPLITGYPLGVPAIPGLDVYVTPQVGRAYVAGVDPAEGNPTSDDSAATWLDASTGEEVAKLRGKLEPSTLAAHCNTIGIWYNDAPMLVERNNHGHAVILWLIDNSTLTVLDGLDERPGWLSNSKGKALLYAGEADAFRDRTTLLHSFDTYMQLASIEGATLRAPKGELDDLADSHALAEQARSSAQGEVYEGAVDGERTIVSQYMNARR